MLNYNKLFMYENHTVDDVKKKIIDLAAEQHIIVERCELYEFITEKPGQISLCENALKKINEESGEKIKEKNKAAEVYNRNMNIFYDTSTYINTNNSYNNYYIATMPYYSSNTITATVTI